MINAPIDAGSYYIRLEGTGEFAGQVANVPFTVDAVDLASADVVFSSGGGGHLYDTVGNPIPDFVTEIKGIDLNGTSSNVNFASTGYDGESSGWVSGQTNTINDKDNPIVLTLSFVETESSSKTPSKDIPGKYVYKLTAKNADGKDCTNIVGEKTITVIASSSSPPSTTTARPPTASPPSTSTRSTSTSATPTARSTATPLSTSTPTASPSRSPRPSGPATTPPASPSPTTTTSGADTPRSSSQSTPSRSRMPTPT